MNDETQIHNEKVHVDGMRRLVELEKSEAFRWFLREAVQVQMEQHDADAKDESKTPEARCLSVAKWNALKTVRTFFDEQRNIHSAALGNDPKSPLDIAK